MEKFNMDQYLEKLMALPPTYWIGISIAFIFLIVLLVFRSKRKKKIRKAKTVAPKIILEKVNFAPLGMGAQINLMNLGPEAIISSVQVIKRPNLSIRQAFTNYTLQTNQRYQIFCEVKEKGRADDGFELSVIYKDSIGNKYSQILEVNPNKSLIKKTMLKKLA